MRQSASLDPSPAEPAESLGALPRETIEGILHFLDEPALLNVALSNRTMLNVVQNANSMWHQRYIQRWGGKRLHDILDPRHGRTAPDDILARNGLASWYQAALLRNKRDQAMTRNWRIGRHRSRRLAGHRDEVFSIMRKGNVLFSGSQDSTIRLWDIHSGDVLDRWTQHTSWVSCLCDDRLRSNSILSGGHDGTIRAWDTERRTQTSVLNFDAACALHGSSEGNGQRYILTMQCLDESCLLVGTMDRTIRLLDLRTERVVAAMPGHNSYVSCLLANGPELYSASGDTQIRQWDLRTMRCVDIRSFHSAPVTCLKKRGTELISSSEDGTIKFWRQGVVRESHAGDEVWGFEFNERFFANGCEKGTIEVRDVANGRLRYLLHGHSGPVGMVLLHDDVMISASEDSSIAIWDFDELELGEDDESLPECVIPVLARDAPDMPAQIEMPASPPHVPFMPENLAEQALSHLQHHSVALVQSFLTSLGFNSQCPPEPQALLNGAQALVTASQTVADNIPQIALRHWGPNASPTDVLPLGPN